MTTVFTPLTKGISWIDSTTDTNNNPLPAGEALVSTTLGIRPDGDASFHAGSYKNLITVLAPASSESVAALNAAVGNLPPGNYWAAVQQTDSLNGQNSTSDWTAEVSFAIPQPVVKPNFPTGVSVS